MSTLFDLKPEQLHEAARAIAKRDAAERHWSRLALIFGRIEDEHLSKRFGYGSTLAYAEHELQVDFEEFFTLMRLWTMMTRAAPAVTFDAWALLPKARAVVLVRILANGGDPKDWFARALAAESADALRLEIDQLLGVERFVVFKVSLPSETHELLEACLVLALQEATGQDDPDVEMARSRRTRHLCLEVVARHFAQTYTPGVRHDG